MGIQYFMTPKQKYLFDLRGYLHLENALTAQELSDTQKAIERLVQSPPDELPPGIGHGGEGFSNGFSADKSLEALTLHPVTWPIIKELTANKPRFNRGSLVVNTHHRREMTPLHCAGEGFRWTRRYDVKNRQIFTNDIVVFFYFTDVYPGDGGLVVLPGSHKRAFERPGNLFFPNPENPDAALHPALVNVTPKAGDVVIITEMLTHGVLVWKPQNRDRRFLILRYKTHFFQDERGLRDAFPPEVMARLSPETKALAAYAEPWEEKDIVKHDGVTLT